MNIALFGKGVKEENIEIFKNLILNLLSDSFLNEKNLFFFAELKEVVVKHLPNYTFNFFENELPKNIYFVLGLGGDGTILDTLSLVKDSGIPVLGVNLGRLGFLSGMGKKELPLLLENLKKEDFTRENRSVLELQLCEPFQANGIQSILNFPYALNEVAIFKCDTASLLSVKVSVNDMLLNTYYGDGVLFATPTGSTAYSLSCGGPILMPESENIIITPVASHTLTVRPFVLPSNSIVEIEVNNNDRGLNQFKIALDSRIYTLTSPFRIVLKKADFSFTTLRLKDFSFFDTIRKKLMWGTDIRL